MPALFAYAPPLYWAAGSVLMALLYFRFWPRRKAEGLTSGARYLVLRWSHGAVWLLLAGSLALHALPDESGTARSVAKLVAVLALLTYVAFLGVTYAPRGSVPAEESKD